MVLPEQIIISEQMIRLLQITLAIIIGTLAAIVYSLRVLVMVTA